MTSFPLSLGSALIAFGPLMALFSSLVYAKAQLVIVVTSSAFFFLMSSVVASFFWWIFYLIGLRGPMAGIIPGILSQFAFRCWFVSIYHRVEKAIQISVQQQEAQDNATSNQTGRRRPNNNESSTGDRDTYEESSDRDRLNGSNDSINNNNRSGHNSNWTETVKLRLELNDAACGIAAGVGFGGMHAILLYGSLLASEMTNNVGVLYQDSCPAMPSLVVSAMYALCFSILDIFFMMFTFFGMRRRLMFHRGERPPLHLTVESKPGAYMGNTREGGNAALLSVLVFHVLASVFTTADYFKHGCVVSLPASFLIVFLVAYWFWAGVAYIYMPPPISNDLSSTAADARNHAEHPTTSVTGAYYNSHND